jgi:hypothetical protein
VQKARSRKDQTHFDANGQIVTDELVGSRTASLTLFLQSRQVSPCCTDTFWRTGFSAQSYDLEPTPEPTTPLLFGTSAAGLRLARWLTRGRLE